MTTTVAPDVAWGTPLDYFKIWATLVTVINFFCGIPIIFQIRKRGDTDEISSFPIVIGLPANNMWLRYGLLIDEYVVWGPNCLGLFLYTVYNNLYIYYTRRKMWIMVKVLLAYAFCFAMLYYTQASYRRDYSTTKDVVGYVAATVQVITFGSPIANIVTVMKNRHCDTMPLPLILFSTVVCVTWLVMGFWLNDEAMYIPNILGLMLLIFQIGLFFVFPLKPGFRAPLGFCSPCIRNLEAPDNETLRNNYGKKPEVKYSKSSEEV